MPLPRSIVLGVCGSIAAVKSVSLAKALRERGFAVRACMTSRATEILAPEALRTVCETAPYVEMWRPDDELGGERHIQLAEWGSAMLIAPATASCLAGLAGGFYDNCVTLVAANFPSNRWLLAPAMADAMWQQPAVQSNVQQLSAWGAHFLGPATGTVASGSVGQRMLEPLDLVAEVEAWWSRADGAR